MVTINCGEVRNLPVEAGSYCVRPRGRVCHLVVNTLRYLGTLGTRRVPSLVTLGPRCATAATVCADKAGQADQADDLSSSVLAYLNYFDCVCGENASLSGRFHLPCTSYCMRTLRNALHSLVQSASSECK